MVDMKDMKDKTEQTGRIADDYNKYHPDFRVEMEMLCCLTNERSMGYHTAISLSIELGLGTSKGVNPLIDLLQGMGLNIQSGNSDLWLSDEDRKIRKSKNRVRGKTYGKTKRCVWIDDGCWDYAQEVGGEYWDRVYGDLALANKEIAELVPVRRAGRTLEELATIQESRR